MEKCGALYLNKLESLSPKDVVENGPVVLEKKLKIGKVYRDRRTDDRRSEKLTGAFSSGELKISYIIFA